MTFFDQIFNKLFQGNSSSANINHKEFLQRSDKEQKKYSVWLAEQKHQSLIQVISKAYFYKKTQIISPIQIHLFQSQGADGFAIKYDNSIGKDNFQHLFDYFKDQILNLNYKLQVSERKISDKGSYVEIKQKYYLKPSIKEFIHNPTIINQRYGNILIEHISIDKNPGYLKFLVTFYQDRLFTKVKDYDELINKLFYIP